MLKKDALIRASFFVLVFRHAYYRALIVACAAFIAVITASDSPTPTFLAPAIAFRIAVFDGWVTGLISEVATAYSVVLVFAAGSA